MKKCILLLLLTVFWLTASSQTATIQTVSGVCPGSTTTVDVTLGGFSVPVSGFQFTLRFDTNYLKYTGTTNWATGISGVGILHNYYGSIDALTFVWGDNPVSVSGLLCRLNFTFKAAASGCKTVIWSDNPTPRLFADDNYNEITVSYTDGMVCAPSETITGTTP
ncbi:MAG TPA: cohesin domain-containing protein, partial [Bacteroidales bacterium]|nr:cohesin domain-containing protein [Bacteroidales bacterium]